MRNIFPGLFTRRAACRVSCSLAANVTVALWLSVQWTCCFGEKAGGWYPTYLITDDVHHTSPTDFCSKAAERDGKGCWISVNKRLTDVAADDLWGSAEDPCHMHAAAELRHIRVKAGTLWPSYHIWWAALWYIVLILVVWYKRFPPQLH